jgi:prepilin-type N-terminal cleavage/methylation domain-containing protein
MMKKKKFNPGFTLIELAVVLFILGLLLSSFLAPLAARVEQQERNNTQIQLDEIREILFGHILQNNYLPCPDCSDNLLGCIGLTANDGIEDTVPAGGGLTCATEVGNLPWVTLGVKGTDEWNNIFTYRVDSTFADRNNATTDGTGCETASATLNVSFSLCSDGDIEIFSSDVTADAGTTGDVATNIPAVVVSHGKNWAVAASVDEGQNTDGDDEFVDKAYSQTPDAEFDDMLIWISPHVLRTMAVKSGILP